MSEISCSSMSREELLELFIHLLAICRQITLSSEEYGNYVKELEKVVKRLQAKSGSKEVLVLDSLAVSPQFLLQILTALHQNWVRALTQYQEKDGQLAEVRNQLAEAVVVLEKFRVKLIALQQPPHRFLPFVQWEERMVEGKKCYWVRVKQGNNLSSVFVEPANEELLNKMRKAQKGQLVRINQMGGLVDILDEFESEGEVVTATEVLPDNRLRMSDDHGRETIIQRGGKLSEVAAGDKLLISPSGLAVEKISSAAEVRSLLLQEPPNVSWRDIGGLDRQIEELRRELEIHLTDPEAVARYQTDRLKGVLLFGPPGTGKTMMVKAAVNETAEILSQVTKREVKGFVILVNGPADVLDMYVGNSPRKIKMIFEAASGEAKKGNLVFIIFDEGETLFSMRQSGGLQDGGTHVRQELVSQLNAEMDGVEKLEGVVVFLLTNRPDMLDAASIRPGRFNLKIHIPRPDKKAAGNIFFKYLSRAIPEPSSDRKPLPLHGQYFDPANYKGENYFSPDAQEKPDGLANSQPENLPLNHDPRKIVDYFIEKLVSLCYDNRRRENRLLKVLWQDGRSEFFTLDRLMSGAVIERIVKQAQIFARDRYRTAKKENKSAAELKKEGLRLSDLLESLKRITADEKLLPTTVEAFQQWLYTEGLPAKDIREVVPLIGDQAKSDSEDEDQTPSSQRMI